MTAQDTLAVLRELFPKVFPIRRSEIRPLKIGVHRDLMAALGEDLEPAIRAALRYYTRWHHYQRALTLYKARFGLDGLPAGEVTEEHQNTARLNVERYRKKAELKAAKVDSFTPTIGPSRQENSVTATSGRPVLSLKRVSTETRDV